ncbi:SMI1/KNR4 family protein [Pleionea sediminis]|uniref:SMI1/KNR4 family protein n=1 Tax=Pleionea sediminis TaxID=2569479 RepID=UPI001185DE4D|nr:SMI1/KNR4 family protein [Pleionea sediminis]
MIVFEESHPTRDYEAEAERFHVRTGYSLPSEYVSFLGKCGAGNFPNLCMYEGLFPIDMVFQLSFEKEPENAVEETRRSIADGRISDNVFVFGSTTDYHTTFCLILDGVLKGSVAFFGDDNLILPEGYSEKDLEVGTILGRSFNDFLSKLKGI